MDRKSLAVLACLLAGCGHVTQDPPSGATTPKYDAPDKTVTAAYPRITGDACMSYGNNGIDVCVIEGHSSVNCREVPDYYSDGESTFGPTEYDCEADFDYTVITNSPGALSVSVSCEVGLHQGSGYHGSVDSSRRDSGTIRISFTSYSEYFGSHAYCSISSVL